MATSATEANLYALRIARMLTGRAKVLVFNGKFHGSVDDTQVELEQGRMVVHQGVIANGLDLDRTTVAVEFNDIPALERALAAGDDPGGDVERDADPAAEHGPPLNALDGRWSVAGGIALTAITL